MFMSLKTFGWLASSIDHDQTPLNAILGLHMILVYTAFAQAYLSQYLV